MILAGGAESGSDVGVGEGVGVAVGVDVATNGPAGAELCQPPPVAEFIARTPTIYVELFVTPLIVMLFEGWSKAARLQLAPSSEV